MNCFATKFVCYRLAAGVMIMQLTALCCAGTIFVDPNGSDDDPGSSSRPVSTITKAVDLASENDVIFIREGQYDLNNTLKIYNKKNIILRASKDESPRLVFKGAKTYGILIGVNSSGITIDGLDIAWSSASNGNIIGIGGKDVVIKNNHIYFSKSSLASKYDGIKILDMAENILIEDNEISGAPQQCIDSVGGTRITVRRNLLYRCSNAVVLKGGASHNVIESNNIFDMKYGAIGVGGFTSAKFITKDYENLDTTVRDNFISYTIDRNIGGGIFLRGAVSGKVYNNTIIGAGIHVKSGGSPKHPEFNSRNNRISDNIILSTGDDGIVVIDEKNGAGLTLENNCYWRGKGSGEFKVNGVWYGYLDFKTKFKFDVNSVFGDPQYERNFALPGNSPCSAMGIKTLREGRLKLPVYERS